MTDNIGFEATAPQASVWQPEAALQAAYADAQRRQTALGFAVQIARTGADSADHVLQSARKFLAFLEGTEPK